jgi:hypothetical protein
MLARFAHMGDLELDCRIDGLVIRLLRLSSCGIVDANV